MPTPHKSPSTMDSITTLSFQFFAEWSISTSSTIARWKTSGEPKGSHLWRKLLYSFLSAGGVKLEIAALFKPGHSKPT